MRTLAYEQIIELANMVAADINIPHIPEDQLRNHLSENPPMPKLIQNSAAQLWIDRYYIAFSLMEESCAHYIYIAEQHAREELQDMSARIRKAADEVERSFLKNIRYQLKKAEKISPNYYIRNDYLKRLKRKGAA